eukprot:TRINITY_DN4438_c0_g1_i4.p1 TRINITY_DN4438_c0_g1~~TRINITY_DN4438_c0_g1_i4.p1  ORF type:complete len:591 (-),score=190.34 TRINITY_DN4438_c0_g1_i4:250-1878(-)
MFDTPIAEKYRKKQKAPEAPPPPPPVPESKKRPPIKKRPMPQPGSDVMRVDPDSGVRGEILVTNDDTYGYTPYSVMLNVTDISAGVNKFYKLQIIVKGSKYSFFVKWGRTGTDVGGKRTYPYSKSEAMTAFEEKFFEMTGNLWEERAYFEKKGGKYSMAELDDGNENAEELEELAKRRESKKVKTDAVATTAPPMDERLRSLVTLIFDKEMMKSQLKSMDVDVKKMPLGKISKAQIQKAYAVLNALTEALQGNPVVKSKIVDGTNRFYTLVPHDFGTKDPPLIDSDEQLKHKLNLLDVLCDIEIATSLMKEAKAGEGDRVQKNYESLKTLIRPIDKASERYKLLEKYALDSHDTGYFKTWGFKVDDIFEIERQGEKDRYKPWSANANRQLLWHGSRLTNYVGILSQGMRIAPPEAPKTGYRFGKGVYFADCVSKSATYCYATRENPVGVMILNEVAVGVPNKVKQDTYMEKAPAGTDSTWALGMAGPDPASTVTIDNGVQVPMGKMIKTGLQTACTHNEIIVYDVAQINIRYLLRVSFRYQN